MIYKLGGNTPQADTALAVCGKCTTNAFAILGLAAKDASKTIRIQTFAGQKSLFSEAIPGDSFALSTLSNTACYAKLS